jgi:hypothetical protein
MATGQQGNMATGQQGNRATGQHGNMATWQHGNSWLLQALFSYFLTKTTTKNNKKQ